MKAIESRDKNTRVHQRIDSASSTNLQHSVKLASQVKSQLSLLEELQSRRVFILNDVSGIVKKS